jgi:uncharacterized protein YigA (DUF484 family)
MTTQQSSALAASESAADPADTTARFGATDVARYLAEHPDFFEQHADVLAAISVPHPQGEQAISLVERQALLLRERIRALEARHGALIRNGEDNDRIVEQLVQWASAVCAQRDPACLPQVMVDEMRRVFQISHAAVRLWQIAPQFAQLACAQAVGDDVVRLTASMAAPFCGSNVGFEPALWLAAEDGAIQSLAMLPLRIAPPHAPQSIAPQSIAPQSDSKLQDSGLTNPVNRARSTFGLLVLGSPDKDRFHITMGTAFLARIADLASAALSRLRAP